MQAEVSHSEKEIRGKSPQDGKWKFMYLLKKYHINSLCEVGKPQYQNNTYTLIQPSNILWKTFLGHNEKLFEEHQ